MHKPNPEKIKRARPALMAATSISPRPVSLAEVKWLKRGDCWSLEERRELAEALHKGRQP
jgi:hypothetical protein